MQRLERVVASPILVDVDPGLPEVCVDGVQLDQVIANLVENAARHAPPDEPIRITARRGRGGVAVTVSDRGAGFSPQARRDAFQPFRSADGSSGIGLAVCKAVVEAHGGTIELLDTGGRGAAVRLTLPGSRRTA